MMFDAPDSAWPVRRFAVWWLRVKPFLVPADGAVRYYDGFAGITLYRHGPFQAQLFVVRPNGMSPMHGHPNIDSVEYGLAGDGLGTFMSERNRRIGPLILIDPHEMHTAGSGPAGGCFISLQKWLNGVVPSSVELDWMGDVIDAAHARDIGRPVVMQSRLHDADMAGYVMTDAGGFVYLDLPMKYDGIGGTDQ